MTEDPFHAASTPPPENGSSFTALLGLPANQAMELLQDEKSFISISSPTFPSNKDLADRAARFSVFAADSPEMTHFPSISSERSNHTFADPVTPDLNRRSMKRNVKEKKGKESAKKKLKTEEGQSEDSKKIPYVHVRARRGQATASHSLAERVRREKINVRMKLLQELVPGCSKKLESDATAVSITEQISGTVLVLDEIINHVQALQRQVELLSMKLAAVNSQIECNVDGLFSRKACELSSDGCSTVRMVNLSSLVGSSIMRPETQISDLMEHHQQLWHLDASQPPLACETEENRTCITSMEDSASGQTLSMNPANAIPNQLKTEL